MRLRSRFFHVVGVLAITGVFAGVSAAHLSSGGATIASAPTVVPGQQEFGNSNDVQNGPDYRYPGDYWKLSLVAGDHVTIDWEAGNNFVNSLGVYPAGTTDFSVNNVSLYQQFSLGANGKAESTFTANQTGAFPLIFWDEGSNDAGPFDFTVYVHHALVLAVSPQTQALIRRAHQTPLPHKGNIVLGAHLADGTPVSGDVGATVFAYWSSKWHSIGKSAARNGEIVVPYRLPASVHGLIRLSVNVGGANYQGRQIGWRGIRA